MEATFPLYSTPLVSGAFFSKERKGPACSLQPRAQATDRRPTTSAAARPPPNGCESSHEAGTSHGTPVPTADPTIAVRYAEQQRLVAEARARLNHGMNPPRLNPLLGGSWRSSATTTTTATTTTAWRSRKAADKDAGNTRKKDGKWFHRLRDR